MIQFVAFAFLVFVCDALQTRSSTGLVQFAPEDLERKTILYSIIGFDTPGRHSRFIEKLFSSVNDGTSSEASFYEVGCVKVHKANAKNDGLIAIKDLSLYDYSSPSNKDKGKEDNSISDCAIAHVHYSEIHNLNALISKFQKILSSVSSTKDSERKKSIIIIASSPSRTKAKSIERRVLQILGSAWSLQKQQSKSKSGNLATEFNLKMLSYIVGSNAEEYEVDNLLKTGSNLVKDARNLSELVTNGCFEGNERVINKKFQLSKKLPCISDIESYELVVDEAVDWARNAVKSNLQRLQKPESADDFPKFVENLLLEIEKMLKLKFDDGNNKRNRAKTNFFEIAKMDVSSQIFSMIEPFYQRYVLLARQDAGKSFNIAVGEDMPITIDIMQDLQNAKLDCVNIFKRKVAAITPTGSPDSWSPDFDIFQLKSSIDEYIEGRESQARIQGILPRGRQPVDVSIHYFIAHPFGRDSRQDPLGFNGKDKFFFKPSPTNNKLPLSNPSKILKRVSGLSSDLKEFAREMLMFPLSVKNPNVRLMGGRSRDKAPPVPENKNREQNGPERFIRWDLPFFTSTK